MQKSDIIAALNTVGADLRCVSCGHEEWRTVVASWDEVGISLQGTASDGTTNMTIDLDCAVLACCRCGFIRLHSMQRLDQADRIGDTADYPIFRAHP